MTKPADTRPLMRRLFEPTSLDVMAPIPKIATYVVLAFWTTVVLFPLYWVIVTSLKVEIDVDSGPYYLPFVDFQPKLDAALDPIVKDVRAGNIYLPQIAWKRSEDILNVEATAQIQQMVQGKVTPEQVARALDTKLASS